MKAVWRGLCVYAVVFWQLLFNHRTITAATFAAFLSIDFTKYNTPKISVVTIHICDNLKQ